MQNTPKKKKKPNEIGEDSCNTHTHNGDGDLAFNVGSFLIVLKIQQLQKKKKKKKSCTKYTHTHTKKKRKKKKKKKKTTNENVEDSCHVQKTKSVNAVNSRPQSIQRTREWRQETDFIRHFYYGTCCEHCF